MRVAGKSVRCSVLHSQHGYTYCCCVILSMLGCPLVAPAFSCDSSLHSVYEEPSFVQKASLILEEGGAGYGEKRREVDSPSRGSGRSDVCGKCYRHIGYLCISLERNSDTAIVVPTFLSVIVTPRPR